mmetsp:Transcript_89694/g.256311  ORF Transcript_89694/g.256311 Transcript_89694/m.256311 type:complete len:204 (+) Transcript_89694:2461-3072(+)
MPQPSNCKLASDDARPSSRWQSVVTRPRYGNLKRQRQLRRPSKMRQRLNSRRVYGGERPGTRLRRGERTPRAGRELPTLLQLKLQSKLSTRRSRLSWKWGQMTGQLLRPARRQRQMLRRRSCKRAYGRGRPNTRWPRSGACTERKSRGWRPTQPRIWRRRRWQRQRRRRRMRPPSNSRARFVERRRAQRSLRRGANTRWRCSD